ncbi:MAG TPA: hypothetical protein VIN38_06725, partial [Thiobacillus sp.]
LMGRPASASRRKPMICSSVKRFFMSNLLDNGIGLQSYVLLKYGETSDLIERQAQIRLESQNGLKNNASGTLTLGAIQAP